MMSRAHSYCLLCLIALVSPIARAKIPMRSNDLSSSGGAVSQQFTSKAKRDEPSSPSNANVHLRKNISPQPQHHATSSSASKDDENENETDSSSPTNSLSQSHSPSVTVGFGTTATGSILPVIQHFLSNSAVPIMKCVATCAQLTLACYIAKVSWNMMRDVWEEINDEFMAARGGKDAGDAREEHDMPYADLDTLSDGLGRGDMEESDESDVDEDNYQRSNSGKRRRSDSTGSSATPQMTATRELATRLRSAGIPYASEVSDDDSDSGSMQRPTRTVEGIVRSLTRAEGNVLTQTLLTPLDGGLIDGSSNLEAPAVAAAAAWNAIGGLSDAKESLLDLAFPLLPTTQHAGDSSQKNNYYGGLLANPPGVLLFGPPGCGKTMLVRALAATVGARFLAVSPACLLRKYVGETNLNVRALFSAARKISPCIIFVDELDGLFRERGGEDHDVGRDLKTEFLQLWDGIRHHSNGGGGGGGGSSSSILVIGATNRPFDVDPAFLRRMPRRVFVGLPDYDSRTAVLQSMLHQVPLDANFDLGLVAGKTGGYSPSDIREVLQAAALYPLREARAGAMPSSQFNSVGGGQDTSIRNRVQMPPLRALRTDDVLRALEVAKPTHFSRRYQKELMSYVHKSGGSYWSDPPASSSPGVGGNVEENSFVADAGTFSGEYFDPDNTDESDSYSYDDDSSDSDYDDL